MALKKKKISDYEPYESFDGLWTLGYSLIDGAGKTVRVSLEFFKKAYDDTASAIDEARRAASNATSEAGRAKTVTDSLQGVKAEMLEALESVIAGQESMEKTNKQAQEQIDSMKALEENITAYVQSAPTRMELVYPEKLTLGNPVEQRVKFKLFPGYVLQNVLFLQAGGDSLCVLPDGKISILKSGKTRIHVIPAHNVSLYRTIEIEVEEASLALGADGSLETAQDGTIITI